MNRSKKQTGEPPSKSKVPALRSKVSGVRALLDAFEKNIKGNVSISVTEYIRLIQLEREMKADEPMDVEVLWIDRMEDPSEGAD